MKGLMRLCFSLYSHRGALHTRLLESQKDNSEGFTDLPTPQISTLSSISARGDGKK